MRIDKSKKYTDGEILIFTEGENEEYEISAAFRVNADFDAEELSEVLPPYFDFESWLLLNGYLIELSFRELHIIKSEKKRKLNGYRK
jgi:hypothetical protein|tara:strand:+ start:265 stop:525 length:261 start_codon:yes stop_codon:yes gene_type:complete